MASARIPSEKLRWRCPESWLKFQTTDDVQPIEGTIGQDRALEALQLGLGLYAPGYNVYIAGLSGTGKMTTIRRILETLQPKGEIARDRCFVHNFHDPDRPNLLTFPRGEGGRFRDEMDAFLQRLRTNLPEVFQSEPLTARKETLVQRAAAQEREQATQFEKRLQSEGFVLGRVQRGTTIILDLLVKSGEQALPFEELETQREQGTLPEADFKRLEREYHDRKKELQGLLKQSALRARATAEEIARLEREAASSVVQAQVEVLKESFSYPEIDTYLKDVQENLLNELDIFKPAQPGEAAGLALLGAREQEDPWTKYGVNLLLDSTTLPESPIVIEEVPSYLNLFGTIEREVTSSGAARTDFTRIKAGSILRADGGFLVLNALDVLTSPGVWPSLKRVLKSGKLYIQPPESAFGVVSALKPEPIDVRVKVIILGENWLYHTLYENEEDFRKIFKVRADFDTEMERTPERVNDFCGVITRIVRDEGLKPLSRDAVGALLEHAVRKAGRQDKICTRFSDIADVLREATFWNAKRKSPTISANDIREAIRKADQRHNLPEEKLQELIQKGVILIATEGKKVGQVNGLAVYQMGQYAFGKPSRITARTAPGKAGVLNIEREAGLSGHTHDKGVLILTGYLRSRYAGEFPLALSATLCFEQSYGMIDGDSASSTELYALLSSLAEIPLRQEIAVTGSVNQYGEIQPIGGVNEKVEGFFNVCKARGLTSHQGVLIPPQNVEDLMLEDEVVGAIREEKFHLYSVTTIDQGIELLTGIPAGVPDARGEYPEGTLNQRAKTRLREYARKVAEFERG